MERFVIFSDMHFHEWTYGARIYTDPIYPIFSGLNDRLVEQSLVISQILEFCKTKEVKHAFFCGDLFHKFGLVTAPVLEIAVRMAKQFKDEGITLYCLVGNHDMYSKDGQRHSLHCISHLCNVISYPYYVQPHDSHPLAMLPYTDNPEVLTNFLSKVPDGAFVFLHQGVANVPMASGYVVNEILKPEMIPDRISMAFTGHYHAHRVVSDKLVVVGAPIQQSFADVGEAMGFIYVDLTSGEITRVLTQGRKFHNISKQEDFNGVNHGDFVRVVRDLNVSHIDHTKFSTFERITPPDKIETIKRDAAPTIKELILDTANKQNIDSTEIVSILDKTHPLLEKEYEIS